VSLERFRKVYSHLPEAERELPIVIVNDERISWEKAYKEIVGKTRLGKEIQKELERLDII